MQRDSISAQDVAVATQGEQTQVKGWSRQDTTWMLSLFGTAVGAGILFLPINAGMGGFWPLVMMAVIIGPMTYLAHRGLSRFVCSSKNPGSDITQVVEEHFGVNAGKAITLLYFFAIFPIVLIYGVGITNTVDSFIVHQLGFASPPRFLLSALLIIGMMSVMVAGEKFMLKVTQFLVYPLVAILAFMSFYLIPDWKMDALQVVPSAGEFFGTVWLTIPVLIFAFNHSPAISQFSVSLKREHGNNAAKKADVILRNTSMMLVGFVMLFVFSCVLSLSPAQLAEAKSENLAILSYLANVHSSGFVSYFGPIIAFIAIISSFFGHYLGATEGLKGMITKQLRSSNKEVSEAKLNKFILAFMFFSIWIVAVINPSILGMIEALGGPIIAAILYLMPMYAVHKVPALKAYRGRISNVFVVIAGLLAMTAILFGLMS
ncbi:serine/threonine transporter [Pseudomonadota bacterium]|uniref:serine/threonine transporter n=1 Tax=unclassified Shewanella TaxID=196818 RepID=UPI000C83DAF9|nr:MULTISPECIES: serine/threonine transporter [unclassified Shewanella]MDO6617908.1 serine/threonine transporter [Shewanella sp. 6_MG-2023]MDO6678312.1 serine/threonine transporter [Shewanella sp. 4_MG-2023]PMG28155.1 HAAAP family serine/threonine permease [Shewanella sp. 10N.286.52.C2]